MTTETTAPDGQSLEQDAAEHEHHHGYIGDKKAYLRRMSRIEGQARGISLGFRKENLIFLTVIVQLPLQPLPYMITPSVSRTWIYDKLIHKTLRFIFR